MEPETSTFSLRVVNLLTLSLAQLVIENSAKIALYTVLHNWANTVRYAEICFKYVTNIFRQYRCDIVYSQNQPQFSQTMGQYWFGNTKPKQTFRLI